MVGFRRLTFTLLFCGMVLATTPALEVLPGLRGTLALGAPEAMITGGISCALKEDPVSLRGEGLLGVTAGEPVWESSLVLGYDLVVPWALQPTVEVGVASAGDGDSVSFYPVVGLSLGYKMSQWVSSLQIRYQSTPFPLPFDAAPQFDVRPVVIVLGLDRILRK